MGTLPGGTGCQEDVGLMVGLWVNSRKVGIKDYDLKGVIRMTRRRTEKSAPYNVLSLSYQNTADKFEERVVR
jgi:hypothetical protein